MTGPKGNSEFSFPEVEGKQNSLFPAVPVVLLYLPLKTRKNCEEIVCFTPAGSQICRDFKEHDRKNVRVERSCCFFIRELVGFVHPRELLGTLRIHDGDGVDDSK